MGLAKVGKIRNDACRKVGITHDALGLLQVIPRVGKVCERARSTMNKKGEALEKGIIGNIPNRGRYTFYHKATTKYSTKYCTKVQQYCLMKN